MFERLKCWLKGTFVCTKCGGTFHLFTFGYGTTVCSECYEGEQLIVNFDDEFWLNRMLSRLRARSSSKREIDVQNL